MSSRTYLLSLPERVIRTALGFSAGLLREIGEVVLPRTVRRGQLYKTLVDTTLRYVIEQVGGAKGVYPSEVPQAQDLLARRRRRHAATPRSSMARPTPPRPSKATACGASLRATPCPP